MNDIAVQYNLLISRYPTKEDVKKASENKILFLKMIYWLGLDQKSDLKILDIGGRGGLFAYYCCSYGHDAYVSDLHSVLEKEPNSELLRLFNVKSIPLEIKAFEPVNTEGVKFDLITGFRTRFHSRLPFETGKRKEEHWGAEEWNFFLSDIAKNILRENGRIFFMLNRLQERKKEEYVPRELADFFFLKGGKLRQQYLLFPTTKKLVS
ncbi:MAG: hypothetical protein ACTFAK_14170 [Candidatus Electronema sp. VV]